MGLFDDVVLSQCLPQVLELIFLRHLPYIDLVACLHVSQRWRDVLTSHLLCRDAPRRACRPARLSHAWTQAALHYTHLDLPSGGGNNRASDVCYVHCSANDVVVVLSRHGQRRCSLLRLDPSAGFEVAARQERVFPGALSSVLATSDLLVFQTAGDNPAEFVERSTMKDVKVEKAIRGKRLTVAGEGTIAMTILQWQ